MTVHSAEFGCDHNDDLYAECTCGWDRFSDGTALDLYNVFNRHLAETFHHPDAAPPDRYSIPHDPAPTGTVGT
jgi:hypothetical protein